MKKLFYLTSFFGLMKLPSIAEEAAKLHAFGGYQYFRDGFADGDKLNGVEGTFSADIAKHVGIASDFSTAFEKFGSETARITTYTFGPVISLDSKTRIEPFAHVLVGGAAALLKEDFFGSENYFAMKAGGGLDVKVSRRLSIRGFQLDWNYFHGHNASYTEEISAATGAVFSF